MKEGEERIEKKTFDSICISITRSTNFARFARVSDSGMSVFKYAHTVTSKHRGPQLDTTTT